jgi:hypothetical protein
MATILRMKYKAGTKMILLVEAKKSAEASMTSIAKARCLKKHTVQQRNARAIVPTTATKTKRTSCYYSILSLVSV